MSRLLLLLFIVLLQSNPPTVSPGDSLFTEYVTWEEVEPPATEPLTIQNEELKLPINIDYDRQLVVLETGEEFPLKEDVEFVVLETLRRVGDKIEMVAFIAGDSEASAWVLNTATGVYSPYITSCTEIQLPLGEEYETFVSVNYESLFNGWVFTRDLETDSPELCHTGTGEHHPLPDETEVARWERLLGNRNDQTLILTGDDAKDTSVTLLYAYNIPKEEITRLGSWSHDGLVNLMDWFGDSRVVFTVDNIDDDRDGDLSNRLEIADIQREDSLEILDEFTTSLEIWSDPRRYEWFARRNHAVSFDISETAKSCQFTLLEPSRNVIQHFDLGYDCDWIQRIENGKYIYLQFPQYFTDHSIIYLLDPVTGKRSTLLTGEFEYLLSVSPDGRYVVVGLDDSGTVDHTDRSEMRHPQLAIFEVLSGEKVYEQSLTFPDGFLIKNLRGSAFNKFNNGIRPHASGTPFVLWLDTENFILRGSNKNDQLLNVERLNEPIELSGLTTFLLPDGKTLILEAVVPTNNSSISHELRAYNMKRQITVPITSPLEVEGSEYLSSGLQSLADSTFLWSFQDHTYRIQLKTD